MAKEARTKGACASYGAREVSPDLAYALRYALCGSAAGEAISAGCLRYERRRKLQADLTLEALDR